MRDRSLRPFDAALCDLDGTLAATEEVLEPLWRTMVEEAGGDVAHFDYVRIIGMTTLEASTAIIAQYGFDSAPKEWCVQYERRIAQALPAQLRPMPGAIAFLDRLRIFDVPLGLVTSGYLPYAMAVLDILGITDRFRVIVTANTKGLGGLKPHPAPYQFAAHQLGTHPLRCVAFEDTPRGVRSARSAGCQTYGIPHAYSPAQGLIDAGADYLLTSLNQFNFPFAG